MISFVLERLAVGSAADLRHVPEEISAMLNVAEEVDFKDEKRLYLKIPLREMTPIPPYELSEAVKWIGEHVRYHGIFIFCRIGMGRAPSIAVAYLCSVGFGYDEAVRFINSRVPEFLPVPNLVQSIEDCINFYL